MSFEPTAYTPELQRYVAARTPSDPILEELAAETDALEGGALASMRMGAEQAALMTLLVRLCGARRALEIGTFTGYGAAAIARGLPEDGLLITCDVSNAHSELARRYWQRLGLADRIEQRIAPALDTLRAIEQDHSFDFAFIDADKAPYPDYYEECLRLVRPGGVIAIDNVFSNGRVVDPSLDNPDLAGIRELNDRIAADKRLRDRVMLSVADGLTLVVPAGE
jgi:caffeoyl-CoA O-methyltransferase